jgi:predicted ATPase/DNA-binding SARP family transcriptional activator
VEFHILGPLEVRLDGSPVAIRGVKQRRLLAALLVHSGTALSPDRLCEILWGEDLPVDPRNALQSQIAQLRRSLSSQGRSALVLGPGGYRLDVAPQASDAGRFETLLRSARSALDIDDPTRASADLTRGLDLWRGSALSEFADQEFATATIARLGELRLIAIESRMDAELRLGRHTDLVPELELLVREHPLRERLCGQLMLARYRAGRQADALQTYHDTRQTLLDEIGVDPSPELTRQYEELLRQEDQTPEPPRQSDTSSADVAEGPVGLPPADLPAPVSSFVGRERELERVAGLLRAARLVTLVGPGGVGKTRLAIESAAAMRDDAAVADGVWFVELAGVADAGMLGEEVAAALGIHHDAGGVAHRGQQGDGGATRVAATLRHVQALLVLDNCEHLIDAAAAFVHTLLAAAPRLTVLCTSREPLGIAGEAVWSVPSLAVAPSRAPGGAPVNARDLLGYEAVQLFVARLQDHDPAFELTGHTAAPVAEICRRLDGVPLALELAAARVRALGVHELARRLDDRFRVLTAGGRTMPVRQRTLHAVVAWSWDLLDRSERTLFRRFAVFRGGATIPDAERVCGGDEALPEDEVLGVLGALVDKSLVVADRHGNPPRYRMLETLRAFGVERLEAAGEHAVISDRHARLVMATVTQCVPDLRGAGQLTAMHKLDHALTDIRAALRWYETSGGDAYGLRLAAELGWYWFLKGARREGIRWLSAFPAADAARDLAVGDVWQAWLSLSQATTHARQRCARGAADVLLEYGDDRDVALSQVLVADFAAVTGDAAEVDHHLALARAAAARAADDGYMALADYVVGHLHLEAGSMRQAASWMAAADDRFEAIGDRWGQVECLDALVTIADALGDLDTAITRATRGIELAGELGLLELEGILQAKLARVYALSGEDELAGPAVDRALRVAGSLGVGSEWVAAQAELAAAMVASRRAAPGVAEQMLRRLLDWIDALPHMSSHVEELTALHVEAMTRLGTAIALRGDVTAALETHADACRRSLSTHDPGRVAATLEAAAVVLVSASRSPEAAILLGAAEARRRSVGSFPSARERSELDHPGERAKREMGDDAFTQAVVRGATLRDDELPLAVLGS